MGAHKSRKVLQGANHSQYRHGGETKAARKAHQETLLRLAYLVTIGEHIKMFVSPKSRGRKPANFLPLDLNKPEELALAIKLSMSKR